MDKDKIALTKRQSGNDYVSNEAGGRETTTTAHRGTDKEGRAERGQNPRSVG
jgi:hypothetical protein